MFQFKNIFFFYALFKYSCFFLGNRSSDQYNYFVLPSEENKNHGILEETLFLLFSSIIYVAIILLFDYKVFGRVYQYFFNTVIGTDIGYKGDIKDLNVCDERYIVDAASTDNLCNYVTYDFYLAIIKN